MRHIQIFQIIILACFVFTNVMSFSRLSDVPANFSSPYKIAIEQGGFTCQRTFHNAFICESEETFENTLRKVIKARKFFSNPLSSLVFHVLQLNKTQVNFDLTSIRCIKFALKLPDEYAHIVLII